MRGGEIWKIMWWGSFGEVGLLEISSLSYFLFFYFYYVVTTFVLTKKLLFKQHSNATFRDQLIGAFGGIENDQWHFCNKIHLFL